MAEISADDPEANPRQDGNVDDVFHVLERQRRKAILSQIITTICCVVLLPATVIPIATAIFLTIPHPDIPALDELTRPVRDYLGPNFVIAILSSVALTLAGLMTLARAFGRYALQPRWDYVRQYKSKVFNHICDVHFPELAYDPKGYIGYDDFDATELFPWESDVYRSEDYFHGRHGKTDICFSEVVAKRERKRWMDGSFDTYYDVFFQGLVFVADFHKHFHSVTRVVPRGAKLKRVWGQSDVILEDPEFEDVFKTVSNDKVDVRYVLSTSMLRRFISLNRRFSGLRALFRNEKLVLMLPRSGNLFEPSLLVPARSSAQMNTFVRTIRSLIRVVEELDLNTRMWTKE